LLTRAPIADDTLAPPLPAICPAQDKSKPGEFQKTEGLTIIPNEAVVSENPITAFQKFFSPDSLGAMFGSSSS
jgi:hypothetical protein